MTRLNPEQPRPLGQEDTGGAAHGRRHFPSCRLKRGIARRAERGHLWVFSNEIEAFEGEPRDGEELIVRSAKGQLLGIGLYSRAALIAVRIYSRAIVPFDAALLRRRLTAALEYRRRECNAQPHPLQAYRLCFGEGDLLPGLIVDCYGDHVVFQLLTAGLERRRDLVLDILDELLHPACLYERSDSPLRAHEGLDSHAGLVRGTPRSDMTVSLNDLAFEVDIAGGQKTGLFLDQVDNWRHLGRHAAGRSVLDMFCYQGGWSLSAARGGAEACLGVDASAGALEIARRNAARNQLQNQCRFEQADAFEILRRFDAEKKRFDLVVLDPPAFAKNRKQVADALRGYRELNLRALRLLEPGGILYTCSCSYHITPDIFDEMLILAARDAQRTVRMLPGTGQAADHPILLATAETHYLKVRALEVFDAS
jgi:23S rRNA (cytosine1962-C5)-methyltransferase